MAIFGVAVLTDYLDGYLARRRNQVTRLGILLDPLADKLLTAAAFLSLVEMDAVPAWMVMIIVGREFAVTGLRNIAAGRGHADAGLGAGEGEDGGAGRLHLPAAARPRVPGAPRARLPVALDRGRAGAGLRGRLLPCASGAKACAPPRVRRRPSRQSSQRPCTRPPSPCLARADQRPVRLEPRTYLSSTGSPFMMASVLYITLAVAVRSRTVSTASSPST